MAATDEQQKIIDYKAEPGSMVCVQAYAGSGKTFTLKVYADTHKDKKMLYLVFNKSIRKRPRRNFQKTWTAKPRTHWPLPALSTIVIRPN